jgi:hypothetical protein
MVTAPSPSLLSPGQMIGNYRIVRPLGEGGMGVVFLAEHQHIARKAAVKVLHPDLSQNPIFAARFLNEARAVNLVRHPGLVEIFEFGQTEGGTAFIIMELIEGESLGERLKRAVRPLPSPAALALGRYIALAVAAAHAKGITHRDLIPGAVPGLARGGATGGRLRPGGDPVPDAGRAPALFGRPGLRHDGHARTAGAHAPRRRRPRSPA